MGKIIQFNKIEATLPDVFNARVDQLEKLSCDFNSSILVRLYAGVIKDYLQSNIDALASFVEKFDNLHTDINSSNEITYTNFQIIKVLALARYNLRLKTANSETIKSLNAILYLNELFTGEILYVISLIYESLENYILASKKYIESAFYLNKIGANLKALKCKLNSVACESRVLTKNNFTPQYENIAKEALEQNEFHTASVALNNISYEYEKISALRAALHYNQEAYLNIDRSGNRSINYYLILLQRCNLLIRLNRLHEAELDFEKCLMSPFLEIKEALKLLSVHFRKDSNSHLINSSHLTSHWRDKVEYLDKKVQQYDHSLTEFEEKFISALFQGSLTRSELIEFIYGNKLDYFILENRVKVILSKIRKKKPGLIIFNNNRYSLSLDLYPEVKQRINEK